MEGLGISLEMFWSIMACLALMVFDVITGFLGAWKSKDINSTKMREGLFHKGALILIIALACMCEFFVLHVPELGISVPLVIPTCVIIFAMELVSITENIAKVNPELADSKLLKLFKTNGDKDA